MEEELQLEQALRCLDIFVGRHAANRGLVHADVLADVAQRERPQVREPLVQEVALELDDRRGDLAERALPLVHRLDEPERRAELLVHVLPGALVLGVAQRAVE